MLTDAQITALTAQIVSHAQGFGMQLADAQDLAAETWGAILRRGHFPTVQPGMVINQARWLMRNRWRDAQRMKRAGEHVELTDQHDLADPSPSPDAACDLAALRSVIASTGIDPQAIDALPCRVARSRARRKARDTFPRWVLELLTAP